VVEGINSKLLDEPTLTLAPGQLVVAGKALERIVAGAANERIVAALLPAISP
jgi:hypothetical protein